LIQFESTFTDTIEMISNADKECKP
jgi:hypothetical protein